MTNVIAVILATAFSALVKPIVSSLWEKVIKPRLKHPSEDIAIVGSSGKTIKVKNAVYLTDDDVKDIVRSLKL